MPRSTTCAAPWRTALPATIGLLAAASCAADPDLQETDATQACITEDLRLGPAPLDTELGPIATPDVLQIRADFALSLDEASWTASTQFRTGDAEARTALHAVADASEILLDGAPIQPDRLVVGSPSRSLIVLPPLEPCTEHTLTMSAARAVSASPSADGPARLERLEDGIFWSAGLEDGRPDGSLEIWFPIGLLHDRFALDIRLDTSALPTAHEVLSTGAMGPDETRLLWTDTRSDRPFWVISPVVSTARATATAQVADGQVTIEVRSLASDPGVSPSFAANIAKRAIERFDRDFGPYPHGDRYLVWGPRRRAQLHGVRRRDAHRAVRDPTRGLAQLDRARRQPLWRVLRVSKRGLARRISGVDS